MKTKDDSSNYITFIIVAMAIMLGWGYFFPPPEPPVQPAANPTVTHAQTAAQNQALPEALLQDSRLIEVNTDVLQLKIDEDSGDIRQLVLPHYNSAGDENKALTLFANNPNHTYVAQSGIIDHNNRYIDSSIYQADKTHYQLDEHGDEVVVTLSGQAQDAPVTIQKIYTFHRGSYVIDIKHVITNNSDQEQDLAAIYRLLRDDHKPEGENFFAYTYAGPVLYTPQEKFEKIPFEDIAKGEAKYAQSTTTGWLGIIQHYFAATWILEPKGGQSLCHAERPCQTAFNKRSDQLYQVGIKVPLDRLQAGQSMSIPMQLFVGPQEYSVLTKVADQLQLVKDYGKVHLFAAPLFWLLQKLHGLVHNWGWAIILLVIIVKIAFYPLTAASYRSMAKMRAVAPKLQALKDEHGDDRMQMQQAMMELYRKEKINPLGGCLPMLIQIPVFIGLYWALLSSVELRQAPWIGWITDLARRDPYYILPIIMAATMFLQTHLNPPPTDPMQAKMMKIMPIMFSILFFVFPAGLVLYYVVNNALSIAQQWKINKDIEKKAAHRS